jgi:type I site-specific restriction endonuclease
MTTGIDAQTCKLIVLDKNIQVELVNVTAFAGIFGH